MLHLTAKAVDALMVHDASLGRAALTRNDAEALLGLLQACLVAMTLTAVSALASSAALPLLALSVLAALAGMEGASGLLRAAQQQGAYREAVSRLDSVLVAPVAGAVAPPSRASKLQIGGRDLALGGRLAITGASGCGKTILLESLVGLRTAPPGQILFDGQPLEAEPLGWARSLFAHAPQDCRLLTGSIADNLRLADQSADEAAMWDVLAEAQLDARVRGLPQGLATWIGDGGEVLSGGERRRLSLARAYLRPAPWLLLDEPTEGLDRETETSLVTALDRRLSRTRQGLIVVSHRPAPLRLCEGIVDLTGRLSASG